MKKVVLPTDFSENAWNATRYAIELFKDEECLFYLLNTYTPAFVKSRFMAAGVSGMEYEDNMQNQSEKGLNHLLQRIEEKYDIPHHSFKTISSFSLLTAEVKEMASSGDIDLIITGTKGASGLEEVFMGSNTVRMINAVDDCPILVVPENYSFNGLKRIALATDFKRNFNPEVTDSLIKFAVESDAEIHVVHINEEEQLDRIQETNKKILGICLKDVKHEFHWMPYFSGKSDAIQYFLEEYNMDMLTLIHYRHGLLENLTREPVVKRIAFSAQTPMLVVPE